MIRKLFVSTLVFVSISCASKAPPVQTPAALKLWQANEAVLYLDQVLDVAIGLNNIQQCPTPPATEPACHPVLSEQNTRYVVDGIGAAVKTIQAVPAGWKATANAALDSLAKQLDAMGRSKLVPYIDVARTLLNSLM